jgi:hypothetical protein
MRYVLAALLAAATRAACSERAPRAGVQAYNVEDGRGPLVERTLSSIITS